MPTARIVNSNSRYSSNVAEDLQAHGYEIVSSNPEESSCAAVDMEVVLRECTAEQASAITSGLPSGQDVRVFISPSALAGTVRSVEVYVVQPKLESEQAHATERIVFESMAPVEEKRMPEVPPVEAIRDPSLAVGAHTVPPPFRREAANSEVVPHGMIWQAFSPGESEEAPAEPEVPSISKTQPIELPSRRRNAQLFWNTAALTGAVAVVVLMGLLLAHRVSPLPRTSTPVSSSSQQSLPFQAPKRPAAQNAVPQQEAMASPASNPAQGISRASMQTPISKANKPSPSRTRLADEGGIAKDTVVNVGHRTAQPRQSRVTHISDLN